MKFTFTCPYCKKVMTENFYLSPGMCGEEDIFINVDTWSCECCGSGTSGGSFKCPNCDKEIDFDED